MAHQVCRQLTCGE